EEVGKQLQKRKFWRHMFELQLAYQAGETFALAKGVEACRLLNEPLPSWLARALSHFVCDRLPPIEKQRIEKMEIYRARWRAVTVLRAGSPDDEERRQLIDNIVLLRQGTAMSDVRAKVDAYLKLLREQEPTGKPLAWIKCWPAAAELLEGTD